ncbi:MAG TPA: sulfite exporter TauE/SafE family protein, partial [Pirellulales bacterium]
VFTEVVPWLILLAAILFTFQPSRPPVKTPTSVESSAAASGGESARKAESDDERASVGARWIAGFSQFLIGVYGGYFGAGLGILTLAVIGVLGLHDIHRMNALKVMLASLINGVSGVVLVIVAYDRIAWSYVAAMCIGSVLGGYWAAHWSRVIDKQRLRRVIAGSSFVLAGIYFALEFWI